MKRKNHGTTNNATTNNGTTNSATTSNDAINSTTTNNGNTNDVRKTTDKTTASGKLPQTGVGIGLTLSIIMLLFGGVIAYFKYNRLKDI